MIRGVSLGAVSIDANLTRQPLKSRLCLRNRQIHMKRSREAVLGDGSPSSSLSSPPLCDTSSEERGTLMVGIPIGGRPYLRMADDTAQMWLSSLLMHSNQQHT